MSVPANMPWWRTLWLLLTNRAGIGTHGVPEYPRAGDGSYRSYRVRWETDVRARSPREAAEAVSASINAGTAHETFEVTEHDRGQVPEYASPVIIDLNEDY